MISFPKTPFLLVCLAVCSTPFGCAATQQSSPLDAPGLRAAASIPSNSAPGAVRLTPELRGDIYMARKMYREAIDAYRLEPVSSAELTNKIGIAFHQLLAFNLAKHNYELAIKMDPKYSEAINNLGTIYYAEKSYRRAIGCYKRALRISDSSASIYANLGAAYFARKDYKQAAAYYEQALKMDPDVFEHHSNFGTLMQQQNVEERAIFHLYLAKTYAKSGANERALIYLRKALEEGVKDRNKIPDLPEFATLKSDPAFLKLLADNPKPL